MLPGDASVQHQIVHAIETAKQGGLAATRRADERRRFFFSDFHIDGLERVFITVVKVEVFDT